MTSAQAVKITPVDTGRLRNSAFVTRPDRKGIVKVGYSVHYAIFVHENTRQVTFKVGEDKFLEKTINRRRSGFTRRLRTMTESNFNKGIGVSNIPATSPESPEE